VRLICLRVIAIGVLQFIHIGHKLVPSRSRAAEFFMYASTQCDKKPRHLVPLTEICFARRSVRGSGRRQNMRKLFA
jgi:hypothetical protein